MACIFRLPMTRGVGISAGEGLDARKWAALEELEEGAVASAMLLTPGGVGPQRPTAAVVEVVHEIEEGMRQPTPQNIGLALRRAGV